jgi:hypothetical protein
VISLALAVRLRVLFQSSKTWLSLRSDLALCAAGFRSGKKKAHSCQMALARFHTIVSAVPFAVVGVTERYLYVLPINEKGSTLKALPFDAYTSIVHVGKLNTSFLKVNTRASTRVNFKVGFENPFGGFS